MTPPISIRVLLSAEILEKQELFNAQYRSFKYAIVNLVRKNWLTDNLYVCGKDDFSDEQVEKLELLKELYLNPVKRLEMNIGETYVEFLGRRLQTLDDSANQLSTDYGNMQHFTL